MVAVESAAGVGRLLGPPGLLVGSCGWVEWLGVSKAGGRAPEEDGGGAGEWRTMAWRACSRRGTMLTEGEHHRAGDRR
jgi:hypothetical protein